MIKRAISLILVCGATLAGIGGYLRQLSTGVQADPLMVEPFALFPVYWYGVIVLLAVGIGFFVAYAQPAVHDSPSNRLVWRYAISIVLGGALGGRLFDLIFITPIAQQQGISSFRDYLENPIFLIDFSWGGLNVWGALFGGGIALLWFCWRTGLASVPIFFKAAVGFLTGLSLAQWGHFINQELYGMPTDAWWGIYIDLAHRLPIFADANRFVPLFLLAAIWYLAGGFLLAFSPRWRRSAAAQLDGILFGLIWFVAGRLMIELNTPFTRFNWLPAVLLLGIIFMGILKNSLSAAAD